MCGFIQSRINLVYSIIYFHSFCAYLDNLFYLPGRCSGDECAEIHSLWWHLVLCNSLATHPLHEQSQKSQMVLCNDFRKSSFKKCNFKLTLEHAVGLLSTCVPLLGLYENHSSLQDRTVWCAEERNWINLLPPVNTYNSENKAVQI